MSNVTDEKAPALDSEGSQSEQASATGSGSEPAASGEKPAVAAAPPAPPPEPLTPEKAEAENRRNDFFILAAVLTLAFLICCFKITDPSLWIHLKAGWQVDQQGVPSHDEFSYATGERPWINLNWLYDWGLYRWELAETRSRVDRLVHDYRALVEESQKPRYDEQGREVSQLLAEPQREAVDSAITGLADSARTTDTHQMRLAAERAASAIRAAGLRLQTSGTEFEKSRYPALAAYNSPAGEQLISFVVPVAIKALLVVALAGVLLCIRHTGPTRWWAAFVVALSLVGMSDHLSLSPMVPNLLCLAMLFWILHSYATGRTWAIWLLVPLEILWVNVHEMFALGFVLAGITVVCSLAGGRLGREKGSDQKPNLTALSGAMVLGLVGATFLNPFGLKAWQVALDSTREVLGRSSYVIAGAASLAGQDSDWIKQTLRDGNQLLALAPDMSTPLSRGYFRSLQIPAVPPLATVLLIVTAAISFVLNRKQFRVSRFLTFLVCVGMFVYGLRYGGVATMAAAVVLSLNGQEWYLGRLGTETRITRGWLLWSQLGRALTVLGVVAVAIAGITGWLGLSVGGDFGFGIHWVVFDFGPAKFLRQAKLQGNALNTVAVQGNMLAWSNFPENKIYVDSRAELHRAELAEFEALKLALRDDDEEQWRSVLDKYGVSMVLLNITNLADSITFPRTFSKLQSSSDWALVHLSSNTVVFGRTDFPEGHRLAEDSEWIRKNRLDPATVVFKQNSDRLPEPPTAVNPPTLVDRIWRTRRVLTAPSLVASHYLNPAVLDKDLEGPVFIVPAENCLLAIRNARVGLASEPRVSPLGYAVLSKAYFYLYNTEQALAASSEINEMRRLQLLTALNQLVAANPDDPTAQLQLALRYRTLNFLDLADKHFDALLRQLPDDAQFENFLFDGGQLLNLSKSDIANESNAVKDELVRIKYDIDQLGTQLASPVAKANYLMARGCPGMAIDQLNEAATFASGINVAPMLARLYVRIGQPGDSEQGAEHEMLNIQGSGGMRPGEKEELWAIVKLMQGDYEKARTFLQDAIAETRHAMAREALLTLTSDLRGGSTLNFVFSPANTVDDVDRRIRMEYHLALLFLESGEPQEAEKHFKQVLELRNDTEFRPIIGFYLERISGEKLEPLPERPKDEEDEMPGDSKDAPGAEAPKSAAPPDTSALPTGKTPAKNSELPPKPPEPPKD